MQQWKNQSTTWKISFQRHKTSYKPQRTKLPYVHKQSCHIHWTHKPQSVELWPLGSTYMQAHWKTRDKGSRGRLYMSNTKPNCQAVFICTRNSSKNFRSYLSNQHSQTLNTMCTSYFFVPFYSSSTLEQRKFGEF